MKDSDASIPAKYEKRPGPFGPAWVEIGVQNGPGAAPASEALERLVDTGWRDAETYFALEVLDRQIQFPWELAPEACVHLEGIWLEDVKRLKAFLQWQRQCGRWEPSSDGQFYLGACEELRKAVLDSRTKAPLAGFTQVKAYIHDGCLRGGALDSLHCPMAQRLVKVKTQRIREVTRQRHQEKHNRDFATNYVRAFYENIAGAVLEHDAVKATAVLKAMTSGDAYWPRWQIVDAFEVALVCPSGKPAKSLLAWWPGREE